MHRLSSEEEDLGFQCTTIKLPYIGCWREQTLYMAHYFIYPSFVVCLFLVCPNYKLQVLWQGSIVFFQSMFPFVVQVEKMKEIAKIKAREERRKFESEVRNIETEFSDYYMKLSRSLNLFSLLFPGTTWKQKSASL